MNFFLLCLLAVFTFIYFWIKNRRNYWKNLGFDYVKLDFPFGSFKGIGTEKSLCNGLDEYYREFKGKAKVVGLFSFVKPVLLIIDPDVIKHVMIQNFDTFHDRYLYYNQVSNCIILIKSSIKFKLNINCSETTQYQFICWHFKVLKKNLIQK